MKQIELTQGQVALVDDDLYDWLNQWKWYFRKRSGKRKGGDAVRTLHGYDESGHVKNYTLYMASIICPVAPGMVLDHKDCNPLNNQRSNLRQATYRGNVLNSRARQNNKTGVKGVHWSEPKQRYIVQATVNGKRKWIGAYKNLEEAAKVSERTIKELYGKYARFN